MTTTLKALRAIALSATVTAGFALQSAAAEETDYQNVFELPRNVLNTPTAEIDATWTNKGPLGQLSRDMARAKSSLMVLDLIANAKAQGLSEQEIASAFGASLTWLISADMPNAAYVAAAYSQFERSATTGALVLAQSYTAGADAWVNAVNQGGASFGRAGTSFGSTPFNAPIPPSTDGGGGGGTNNTTTTATTSNASPN